MIHMHEGRRGEDVEIRWKWGEVVVRGIKVYGSGTREVGVI